MGKYYLLLLWLIVALCSKSCIKNKSIKDLKGGVVVQIHPSNDFNNIYNEVWIKDSITGHVEIYKLLKIDTDYLQPKDTIK